MKSTVVCCSFGAVAFVLAGIQAGLFRAVPRGWGGRRAEVAPAAGIKEATKPVKARFPEDLVPAARAEPVPQAAAYDAGAAVHRLVVLKTTGALYQEWQEKLRDEWLADSVEEASLALIVGPQKKTCVDKIHYPQRPGVPISLYNYELEASVVELKTGQVLANNVFINKARPIQHIETWNTTALGSPVEFRTVFSWAAAGARAGFPRVQNPAPIVTISN